jgi:hypothetical protein
MTANLYRAAMPSEAPAFLRFSPLFLLSRPATRPQKCPR